MQVTNLSDNILKYYTKGTKILLKPGVSTYVSDEIITAKKLKDCYGNRVRIIDEANIEKLYKEYAGDVEPAKPFVQEENNKIIEQEIVQGKKEEINKVTEQEEEIVQEEDNKAVKQDKQKEETKIPNKEKTAPKKAVKSRNVKNKKANKKI